MRWWQGLDTKSRVSLVAAAVVVLGGAIALTLLLSGDGDTPDSPSKLAETTPSTSTDATPSTDGTSATNEPVVPDTPTDKEPSPTEPSEPERIFGALRGIRDESGGSWQELWVDIDTADFLTGDAALAYLTSQGDQDFYDPDYWYVRDEGVAITSYLLPASAQGVEVVMYTYPTVPPMGFYGPAMDEQIVPFGQFYDAIYMSSDPDGLLGRYYWFTVEEDVVVRIEEQPHDPYYEP